jgi:hypothetical protein
MFACTACHVTVPYLFQILNISDSVMSSMPSLDECTLVVDAVGHGDLRSYLRSDSAAHFNLNHRLRMVVMSLMRCHVLTHAVSRHCQRTHPSEAPQYYSWPPDVEVRCAGARHRDLTDCRACFVDDQHNVKIGDFSHAFQTADSSMSLNEHVQGRRQCHNHSHSSV